MSPDKQARIIEANISFDYNDHFTDKKGTSGYSGVNGQPSVVWLAKLDISATELYLLQHLERHVE